MMMIMALRIMKVISQCNPHGHHGDDDDCEEGDDNHDDYFSDDSMNT